MVPLPPKPYMPKNCAVREHTGDGHVVGRCWHYVGDGGECPRHGDVREVQTRYVERGELTNDWDLYGRKPRT